jgi:hypothetical protein
MDTTMNYEHKAVAQQAIGQKRHTRPTETKEEEAGVPLYAISKPVQKNIFSKRFGF